MLTIADKRARVLLVYYRRNPRDVLVYTTTLRTREYCDLLTHCQRGLFLALSMHGRDRMIVASGLGKVAAILFPVLFISLLQVDAVERSWMGFFVLADLPCKRPLTFPLVLAFSELTLFQCCSV